MANWGLESDVNFIFVDSNNNLWILANESLNHIDGRTLQHTLFTTTTLGLDYVSVRTPYDYYYAYFVLDKDNNAWVHDTKSLARIDGVSLQPALFPSSTLGGR